MISQAKDKKKLKFGADWLWCIGEGYEQKENKESFLDATFSKNGETTGFIFEFDKIEAITLVGKKKMNFYYDNKTYQVFKNKRINLLKYMHMFYVLKNKKEGISDGFIGI